MKKYLCILFMFCLNCNIQESFDSEESDSDENVGGNLPIYDYYNSDDDGSWGCGLYKNPNTFVECEDFYLERGRPLPREDKNSLEEKANPGEEKFILDNKSQNFFSK